MFKPLLPETDRPDTPNPRIKARLLAEGEEGLWSNILAQGWSEQAELQDFLQSHARVVSSIEGAHSFFAHLDGEPVATAVLHCHEGVALLAGASTVPAARNQGAHRALSELRIQTAIAQGCDLAMQCAEPGSTSQRNAERQGFRIAYTRTKWCLA
jgi:GNAT superfamily N-acetyltransferase